MNKTISNEDDLFLKDQFCLQTQDFYQQNNNINTSNISNTSNYIYNNSNKQDLSSTNISNYDNSLQYGNNNYYYNDPLMLQQPQFHNNSNSNLHPQEISFLQTNEQMPIQFNQISLDMIFEKNISNFVKSLHKAYIDFKYEILTSLQEHYQTQQQLMSQSSTLHGIGTIYDYDTDVVIDMFRIYGMKFIKFVENIPGK